MILWRVVRRLLALGVRLLVVNRVLVAALAGLLLLGFVVVPFALSEFTQGGAPTPAARVSVAVTNNSDNVPVASVENYLKGMSTFDANLVWSSFSDDAIRQMTSNGLTLQSLQQSLDDQKQQGTRYQEIAYIGKYPLRDGSQYLFYVVSASGVDGTNNLSQVFFVFTVNPDGKIAKIE